MFSDRKEGKLKIEAVAEVDAECVVPRAREVAFGEIVVRVEPNNQGLIAKVAVQKRVIDYKDLLPRLTPGAGTRDDPHVIHNPSNSHLDELLQWLQYLESLGGFWFRINKIKWESADFGWIPESEEEKGEVSLSRFKLSRSYDYPPVAFRITILKMLLERRTEYEDLTLPMSFLREGTNEFRNLRYASAFVNFYFVLEDLYGRGKTKNQQVEQSFKNASELTEAVAETLQRFDLPAQYRHSQALDDFLQMEGRERTVAGVLSLLVRMRGNMLHFSQKSTKKKATPLNQGDFETLAFLALTICMSCIVRRFKAKDKLHPGRQ